jgi:hypothetical protein
MSNKISTRLIVSIALLFTLFLGLFSQERARGDSEPTPQIPISSPSTENSLFLPLIGKAYPATPPVYGVETFDFAQWKLDKSTQSNVNWVRNATFSWNEIEPTAPNPNHTYHWEYVDNAGLIRVAQTNLTVIATIKETPPWARMSKYSNYICGPIDQSALDDFYQFVYNLVRIYSAPPYNIRYYEFGNEPDIDPTNFGTQYDLPYGCWGDKNDPYYGGAYYATMLKQAYPAAKSADSRVKILNGGLLLSCDPRYAPPPGETCLPAKFLEGIFLNQGAAYFDILAFHGYPYYGRPYQPLYPKDYALGPQIVDEKHVSFDDSGGQLVGKVDYLRYVMRNYGVTKPIISTEIGLICAQVDECNPPTSKFLELQGDYIVQTYVRTWGLNLLGATWYTLEDSNWKQTGLFSTGAVARPAYNVLVFMTNELKNASIGPALTQYAGLKGYEFTTATKRIWVLWAPNGITGVEISMPANVNKIYDKIGNLTTTIPSKIIITHPTYLEFLR